MGSLLTVGLELERMMRVRERERRFEARRVIVGDGLWEAVAGGHEMK